jgi:glycosyltransferase involved in cell wall biosynthesis
MRPFFSIITPTIQRESLVRCCHSLDVQTCRDFEHIVVVDDTSFNWNIVYDCISPPTSPIHQFTICGIKHQNYGNSCRHAAWEMANGHWLIYLDDDNYLADEMILRDMRQAIEWNVVMSSSEMRWFLFPILRHGHRFFSDPPGLCHTDTANFVVKREIGRWPDGPEYTMDGIFVEQLKAKYPYKSFPDFRPIVVMEKSGEGHDADINLDSQHDGVD